VSRATAKAARPIQSGPSAASPVEDPLALPMDGRYDGVPEHLEFPLRELIAGCMGAAAVGVNYGRSNVQGLAREFAQQVSLRLRVMPAKTPGTWDPYTSALVSVDRKDLLRVVNCMLQMSPGGYTGMPWVQILAERLKAAGSAYEVSDLDGLQLVRRTDATVSAITTLVMTKAASAGQFLKKAYMASIPTQTRHMPRRCEPSRRWLFRSS
jgi:hypothetical protein